MSADVVALTSPRVQWFVPGEPISWARAGRGGRTTFTPKRVRDAEAHIVVEFWKAHPEHTLFGGDVALHVEFFAGQKRRRDIDNQVKLVMDALNGVVWGDDAQVQSLVAHRRGAVGDEVPGTWIVVEAR